MMIERVERSIALAKDVAQKLGVDLFDDRRRGQFRHIVQNCVTCAYQSKCLELISRDGQMDKPLQHCRNRDLFS